MKENDLIKYYIENNNINIEKLMNDYTSYLYATINNKNSNLKVEDIEEIISDVFLAIWNNQEKLDIEKKMSSYLAGIAKNICNNKIRSLKNYTNINGYENNLYEIESLDRQLESTEKEKIIIMGINNMKQEDKDIFILYYYYSKSMKEIAEKLQITETKVKSRLFRIRIKIKKILEKRGYSYNG